jgi:TonB family protein
MSLAQKYRLHYAAQRGDRFILCLATAVVMHLGAMGSGLILWQRTHLATLEAEATVDRQPIEFIYLNTPAPATPPDTLRRANVTAIAGGEQQPNRPVNAGGSGKVPGSDGAIVAAAPNKTQPAPTVTAARVPPMSVASEPASRNASSERVNQNKELEAEPSPDPKASESAPVIPPPRELPTLAAAAPVEATAPPMEPVSTTPPPVSTTPPPNLTSADATPPPVLPTPSATNATPVPMGVGLDGLPNPDRSAPGEAGANAVQDPIWDEYTAVLNRSIYQHWQRSTIDSTRETKVRFVLGRTGNLVDLQLVQASGSDTADQAAIAAVEAAAPFAPLPETATEDQLIINFTFTYTARPNPTASP